MGKGNSIKKRQNKLNQIRNQIEAGNYKRALYEIVNYVKSYPDDTLGHYLYGKLLLRFTPFAFAFHVDFLVWEYITPSGLAIII